jgi:hypothetical protein
MPSDEYREKVVKKGERPPIDRHWSHALVRLLESCWDRNPLLRPKARDVYKALREEIQAVYESEFRPAKLL